jgi:4-amino-4-deoxy-L-arabinose transferase-like glycosyltransferase
MKRGNRPILFIYLFLWFIVNLLFLTNYPFVHSDEPWLSGLSRTMIEEKSLSATEDFFDLYERNPHAIKILFHSLQILFIKVLGYSLFTVRLISLLAGLLTLILMNRLINNVLESQRKEFISLIIIIWMSLDIQFIYISHFARQEIVLIGLMILSLVFLTEKKVHPFLRGVFSGITIGLAVGFHPNSFIIAWPAGLLLAFDIFFRKRRISEGILFLLPAALLASLFVSISFYFNPDFISDYKAYGEPLGVLATSDMKLIKVPGFYSGLFHQISGTYHTPSIRLQMILFPFFLIPGIIRKKSKLILCGFAGFNMGLIIIGKYSPPSISFLLPFYYLGAAGATEFFISLEKKKWIGLTVPVLIFLTFFFSLKEIRKEKDPYTNYLSELRKFIPGDAIALGNLNTEYLFTKGRLYSWRNLYFLTEENLSLPRYISERKIQYIIVPEELDFIYRNRPYWNVLYGNIALWYPSLEDFLETNCQFSGEFSSPAYGMRIAAYRYTQPWNVKIYKVNYRESIIE